MKGSASQRRELGHPSYRLKLSQPHLTHADDLGHEGLLDKVGCSASSPSRTMKRPLPCKHHIHVLRKRQPPRMAWSMQNQIPSARFSNAVGYLSRRPCSPHPSSACHDNRKLSLSPMLPTLVRQSAVMSNSDSRMIRDFPKTFLLVNPKMFQDRSTCEQIGTDSASNLT